MIDDTPTETAGVGIPYSFRDRNKSKEIQHEAFTTFQPSHISTFDQIKPMKHIPHEKFDKMKRKYERLREKRATSVLNTYSEKLAKVMETLPFDKLSPPFRSSVANVAVSNKFNKRRNTSMLSHPAGKTFFKGATSFALQANGSL